MHVKACNVAILTEKYLRSFVEKSSQCIGRSNFKLKDFKNSEVGAISKYFQVAIKILFLIALFFCAINCLALGKLY